VWVLQIASGQFLNLTKGKVDVFNTTIRALGFTPDGSHVTIMQAPSRAAAIGTTMVPTIGGMPRQLLDGGLDPSWSADGKRLLFIRLVENKDPMFIADPNGANPKQVFPVQPGEHNHFMAWSPNGKYVYSVRSTRNIFETDVWRASSAGGPPERITSHNDFVAYPTPFDDRTLMYIASDEHGAGSWLYAMDLDTRKEHRLSSGIEQYTSISISAPAPGRQRRIVATVANPVGSLWTIPITKSPAPESAASPFPVPSAQVSFPHFGPGYLLYLSSRELADSLWKLEGGSPTELWRARDGPIVAMPSASPDGKHIAIAALRDGRAGLYVITSEGANPQPLAPSLDVRGASSWSPDGKLLAVTAFDGKQSGLFLVALDGSPPVRIYDNLCYHVLWAPDGKYLLFAEYVQGVLMRARAITPEGKPAPVADIRLTQVQLARSPVPYRFLPGGKELVLLDGGTRQQQFYIVNVQTGERRQLTDLKTGSSVRGFDVSPDGKRILFDRVEKNSDVVLVELAK
jgi:Tol biopolymer transport system component